MNLVVDCIQVVSGHPLVWFRRREPDYLLIHFRKALKRIMSAPYRHKLNAIYEHVKDRNEAWELWKDPEVYNPVEYIALARDEEYFPYLFELLQLLVGLKDIRRSRRLPDGYYRLLNLTGRVYEVRNGRSRSVRGDTIWRIPGFKPDVYLPRPGMFEDLLGAKLYPDVAPSGISKVKQRLSGALELMKGFSRDIWEDFQDIVFSIVLLTDPPGHAVDSLTMTSKYFGGVFLNGFRCDEYKGVESLVHEYIHNRMSLWWELSTPTGVPGVGVSIVSPVTGNKVQASTMIHAFVIYVFALQFYRHVQETAVPSDLVVARRLNARAAHIAKGIPMLRSRLARHVRAGTDMKRLFEYLMEVYEPLKNRG